MIKIINESVQLIHIDSSTTLTPQSIQYALMRAMSNKMYAKFYTDKYYITVNFNRDNTINVSSNITLPQFVSSLWKMSQLGWTFERVKTFIYTWMQLNRKSLPR